MFKLSVLVLVAGLFFATVAVAQQQTIGPLDARNNLSEIAGNGSTAQTTARTNLGLGSIAVQGANTVAITGGVINGLSSIGTSGPINLTGSGTSSQYDAQISITGGGSAAGQGEVNYLAAYHNFETWDGSFQFRIGANPYATEYLLASGTPLGGGGVLYATNATDAIPLGTGNVNEVFVAQNQGIMQFANGSGPLFSILDPGAPTSANLTTTPGTATSDPTLGSTSGVIAVSAPGASGEIRFYINGAVMGKVINRTGSSTTSAYPSLFSASTNLAGFRCENITHIGAITCFLQAQSGGAVTLADDTGNLATFATSALGTIADNPLVRTSSASQPIIITGNNLGDSVATGSASLATNAIVGFADMPTCAGAAGPTGIPTKTAGWAPHCFNPTTNSLNIWNSVSNTWVHFTGIVGAN